MLYYFIHEEGRLTELVCLQPYPHNIHQGITTKGRAKVIQILSEIKSFNQDTKERFFNTFINKPGTSKISYLSFV